MEEERKEGVEEWEEERREEEEEEEETHVRAGGGGVRGLEVERRGACALQRREIVEKVCHAPPRHPVPACLLMLALVNERYARRDS